MTLDKLFTAETINQIPGYITVHSLDSTIYLTNDDSARLMGYSNGRALEGKNYFDMRCKAVEDADKFFLQDKEVFSSGKTLTFLSYHCYANNEWKIILGNKKPIFDKNRLIGLISHWQDISGHYLLDLGKFLLNNKQASNQKQFTFLLNGGCFNDNLTLRELECLFY